MRLPKGLGVAKKAAIAYTGCFLAGSVLSIKRGYPANALGLELGTDVRRGVLGGVHGAGLAAPWNLIIQMWVALAMASRHDRKGRRARGWLALLSALFVAGHVGEPVSHKIVPGELPPPETFVAVASIALPIVMLCGALISLTEEDKS